jgi:hypothetical protein
MTIGSPVIPSPSRISEGTLYTPQQPTVNPGVPPMRTVLVQQPQQPIVQSVYTPVVVDSPRSIIRTISSNILVSSVIRSLSHVINKPILLAPGHF